MTNYNPFVYLPDTLCDDFSLPAFPECQTDTAFAQLRSQVCGIIVAPVGATLPGDVSDLDEWLGVIDNTNTDGTKARYITGFGSFLPSESVIAELSGGRLRQVKDRGYRLTFDVVNMDSGHQAFGRKLEGGYRRFDMWLETVGGRIIGGAYGMRPFFTDAVFLFDQDANAREVLRITVDFFFSNSRQ